MPTNNSTINDIKGQPKAIKSVLKDLEKKKNKLARIFSESSTFCFVGCGASYYLSLVGSSLLNRNSLSFAFPGSEVFISDNNIPKIPIDTIVPVSRSGESTETIKATKFLKEREIKPKTVGLTCTKESSIQKTTDISILAPKGLEENVVMTKSFSSMLVAIEYLSRLKQKKNSTLENFKDIPTNIEKTLKKSEKLAKEIISKNDFRKFVFLGTGKYYGLAAEAMLLLEEMSLSWSKAYHPLEFRHGPRSIADKNTLVTLFASERGVEEQARLIEEIGDLGANTLTLGGKKVIGEMKSDYSLSIPLSAGLSLSLYIPFAQFVAYFRALELDLDPDNPRNLTKVVEI